MKLLRFLPVLLIAIGLFSSCQKELSVEGDLAVGTLKDDGTGDCLPVMINGTYKQDTVLKASNYVDIQADITMTGSYLIKSDTVNGYSFSAIGTAPEFGTTSIRLIGSGKPLAPGVDVFTVTFGETTCQFNIVVTGAPTTPAVFNLGGSPGTCTGAVLTGTYMAGLATSAANTVTLNVNVTTPGTYTLSISTAVNGVTFSGSGTFTTLGPNTITLAASGTPAAAGTFTYPVTVGTDNCSFDITYSAAAGPAVYTLSCGTPVLAGTYQAGTTMTAANTMTVGVNVTGGGTYSITTNSMNGVTFSGSGVLPATPAAQTVTLTATGTPVAGGPFTYTLTGASTTCTVPVTYTAAASVSVFTFTCAPAPAVAGDYRYGVVLDPTTNTVTVTTNVVTAGTYTISLAPTSGGPDGTTFTKSGTFAATGPQTVVITGTGTPTRSGNVNYTISSTQSTNTCTVDIYYDFLTMNINGGGVRNFSFDCSSSDGVDTYVTGYDDITIGGFASAIVSDPEGIGFAIGLPNGSPFIIGPYTVNDYPAKIVLADYTNPAGIDYQAFSDPPTVQSPAFTVTITAISATRIEGTFSGPLKDNTGAGPGVNNVVGTFSIKR